MSTKAIVPILYTFENGKPDPSYRSITLFHDGDGGRLQVTLGVGYTEGGGDLKQVLARYLAANDQLKSTGKGSQEAAALALFVNRINDPISANTTFLAASSAFQGHLKAAGKEAIMQQAQDLQFQNEILGPATNWATANGFNPEPLSLLVIADSFLQSGEVFSFLRDRFSEKTPANGGDEQDWIRAYTETRHQWLLSSGKLLAASSYRTAFLLDLIDTKDWNIAQSEYSVDGTPLAFGADGSLKTQVA
jgi:chitosanase